MTMTAQQIVAEMRSLASVWDRDDKWPCAARAREWADRLAALAPEQGNNDAK